MKTHAPANIIKQEFIFTLLLMKIDVKKIAKLANLPLREGEMKPLEKALIETLSYVNILEEVDTKNVEPTSQVTGLENVTREDLTSPSLSQDKALVNAKKKVNGMFEVPRILDKG